MIKHDLIGKIAEGTVLTRKTVAAILQGISPIKFAMFKIILRNLLQRLLGLLRNRRQL